MTSGDMLYLALIFPKSQLCSVEFGVKCLTKRGIASARVVCCGSSKAVGGGLVAVTTRIYMFKSATI